ncbi:phage tail tube protein [[Haemophilus] ducreyi]
MRTETYSYGQGAVYLAERLPNGQPGAFRWVGDVSELSVSLSVEEFTHKESYSGQRQEVKKIITGKSGEVLIKFHEMSKENLSLMLLGEASTIKAGNVTKEALPDDIKAGDRIALAHQNVSDVKIAELKENTDFVVDAIFGTIEFLKEQKSKKLTVDYNYGDVDVIALLTTNPKDLFLRFEGINLAETNEWNLVELYKINFNPTEALNLINNENALDALSAKAKVLADTTKAGDSTLGRFGRVVKIKK